MDAWDDYRAGKFTGEKAAEKGWQNLINHVPVNSIMISIDKYPKSANIELEPEEIQNRIKARDHRTDWCRIFFSNCICTRLRMAF